MKNDLFLADGEYLSYHLKLVHWMNALLKLKHSDFLNENGIEFKIENHDYARYNQMLNTHDFNTIDFLDKSPEEIMNYKKCYEEVCGEIPFKF